MMMLMTVDDACSLGHTYADGNQIKKGAGFVAGDDAYEIWGVFLFK